MNSLEQGIDHVAELQRGVGPEVLTDLGGGQVETLSEQDNYQKILDELVTRALNPVDVVPVEVEAQVLEDTPAEQYVPVPSELKELVAQMAAVSQANRTGHSPAQAAAMAASRELRNGERVRRPFVRR